MTLLKNSSEGGTSGVAVSTGNSGGASGNAFDAVTVSGAGAALAFDNSQAAHGTLSAKYTFPSGVASTAYASWTTSAGSTSPAFFRLYLRHAANPSVNTRVWQADISGSVLCAALYVNTSGTLQMTDSAGTNIFTTTATVPLSQWYRLEGYVTGSPSAGQVELKLFKSADSTAADEVKTSSAAQNTGGVPNSFRYGCFAALTQSSPFTLWADDIGLSSTGYLGPVVYPGRAQVQVAWSTEPFAAPLWTDVTDYIRLEKTVSLQRGRQDNISEVQAGS